MDTLWLPVSYLGFGDWRRWDLPDGQINLSCELDLSGLVKLHAAFSNDGEGGHRFYNSLSEIGDHPIYYKLAKRAVNEQRFCELVYEAIAQMMESGLDEEISLFFQNGDLPSAWYRTVPWGGKLLWLPLSFVRIYANQQWREEDGQTITSGTLDIDRFFQLKDVVLMSQREGDEAELQVNALVSGQLREWVRDAFVESGAARHAFRRSRDYECSAVGADLFQSVHIGYAPPASILTA